MKKEADFEQQQKNLLSNFYAAPSWNASVCHWQSEKCKNKNKTNRSKRYNNGNSTAVPAKMQIIQKKKLRE